jgi:Zn-dependent protease
LSLFVLFLLGVVALAPAAVIAIPVHELGHAVAAYLLGDRSVRYFGYLRPDPRRYLDPLGTLAVFLALVGWGRRVPIQQNRIDTTGKKVLYELGGPAANLAVAVVLGVILQALHRAGLAVTFEIGAGYLGLILFAVVFVNLSIMAFQLLPIPGLDGWNIVEAIFRSRNPRFFFDVSVRRREVWAGCVIVLIVGQFLAGTNLLNVVLTPFFEPASLISLGQCAGYAVPGFIGLFPCLL